MIEKFNITSPDLNAKISEDETEVTIAEVIRNVKGIGEVTVVYFRDKRLQVGHLESEGITGQLDVSYMFPTMDGSPIQIGIEVSPNKNIDPHGIQCKLTIDGHEFKGVPFFEKPSEGSEPDKLKFYAWQTPEGIYLDTLLLQPTSEFFKKISCEIYRD
jgi:hypothetical protein